MYLFSLIVLHGLCEDYLTCDIAFNAVMPLSRASTHGRYRRIEGVTAEQSGNIAKQRFARTWWVRGLTWQIGRHDKQVVGIVA